MNLTTRILRARKEKRLSQQALADLIGVSRSALAQWETEMSSPSLENLRKMAEILEISFEWVATGRGNQYLTSPVDSICDTEVDGEIMRALNRMNLKKKRAILNVMKAMA
ncbi:helix-turn-helix transcriptional regulator [Endozoicomonas montiporae]|uniref:Transcriptional regulator PbsX family n=1 Tax=Endozoicomonas montiporae CL-33 TaxID=570277 RepID=A0A142BBZ6_9GAMM|nr:helix-turn-helix transcriptional regulator [Endozoicomonas montiporae]AMO56272.1 transcriptional regulator PbsX family [Endozoicomonas montiporae CL-33]